MRTFYLIYILLFSIVNAQEIKFISKTTNKPLANILIFDKNGNLITKSDINGLINKEEFTKEDYYLVSHENIITDTLKLANLEKEIFYISDKIVEIKPIVLERKEDVKEYYIKGYFITYIFMNKKFNCYADGIITYKINKQENKVENEYVDQYRVFTLKNMWQKYKSVASFDLKTQMKLPKLDVAENIKTVMNNDKYSFYENKQENEEISLKKKNIESMNINFLGFQMNNFSREIYANYLSGASSKNYPFNYLNKFSNTTRFNMKHKSEENNNDIVLYTEFTPISYEYTKPKDEVSFSKNKSSYQESYWKDNSFPNTISLFSSFFKNDIEEQKNNRK